MRSSGIVGVSSSPLGAKNAFLTSVALILCLAGCGGQNSGSQQQAVVSWSGIPPIALSIETEEVATAHQGLFYLAPLHALGGMPPYTWTVVQGSLPADLSIDAGAGTIAGTPSQLGAFVFVVQVSDSSSTTQTAEHSYNISVNGTEPGVGFGITTASVPNAQIGVAYKTSFLARGGAMPLAWTVDAGGLPPGLALAESSILSGDPTATGTFIFDVAVKDASNPALVSSHTYCISVAPAALAGTGLRITTGNIPNGALGQPYSATLSAENGTGLLTWAVVEGTLPPGIQLSSDGQLSGTPTTPGTYTMTFEVADRSVPQQTATQSLGIAISPLSPPSPSGEPSQQE